MQGCRRSPSVGHHKREGSHDGRHKCAAAACRVLADLLRATWLRPEAPDLATAQQAAQTAVQAVVRAYAATPSVPAGPAQRDGDQQCLPLRCSVFPPLSNGRCCTGTRSPNSNGSS